MIENIDNVIVAPEDLFYGARWRKVCIQADPAPRWDNR